MIGGKAGMATKVAAVQNINPAVKFHFSFHPRSYLGYIHNDPCEIAFGFPFNETGPATEGCSIYAGHWLYRAGTTLTNAISANQPISEWLMPVTSTAATIWSFITHLRALLTTQSMFACNQWIAT